MSDELPKAERMVKHSTRRLGVAEGRAKIAETTSQLDVLTGELERAHATILRLARERNELLEERDRLLVQLNKE